MLGKCYRVITDEPQGICVGFEPPQSDRYEYDEHPLVADDAGDNVFFTKDGVVISETHDAAYGTWAEPDQQVWRSLAEFELWLNDEE